LRAPANEMLFSAFNFCTFFKQPFWTLLTKGSVITCTVWAFRFVAGQAGAQEPAKPGTGVAGQPGDEVARQPGAWLAWKPGAGVPITWR